MKKIIRILGILLVSAFMLLPLKTRAAEPVWTQELDLNDSVSSAIAKVEDGVVVMQYEGTASASNLLIKYDFNGKKIWEIDNDYGYNIESVSDGFIVWSETKITKFDKDKNILWSKDITLEPTDADYASFPSQYVGLGGKLIEFKDYYLVYQVHYVNKPRNNIFSIDKKGNIVKRISINDFLTKNNISCNDFWLLSVGVLSDNEFSLMYSTEDFRSSSVTVHISEVTNDFTIIGDSEYQFNNDGYDFSYYGGVDIRSVISTDRGYIVLGTNVIYLLNDGSIKLYNKLVLDVIKSGNYIYTYEYREISDQESNNMLYDAYIVQYNMNMEEQATIKLPLSCDKLRSYSGLAQLTNRFILKDHNNVVALNTPIFNIDILNAQQPRVVKYDNYKVSGGSYSLSRYRFSEEGEDGQEENSTPSGIINNIIKNPKTNSVIIIVVFVVLTLAISITSYLIYKKKK